MLLTIKLKQWAIQRQYRVKRVDLANSRGFNHGVSVEFDEPGSQWYIPMKDIERMSVEQF